MENKHTCIGRGSHSPAINRQRLAKARAGVFQILLLLLIGCSPLAEQTTGNQPGAPAATRAATALGKAAVAMPDHYSAEVAEGVLRAGGNAVDAAVAAGFALAVTYPEAGNLGGGGFMLIHMRGEDSFVDYREQAPAAAQRDMYLDERGEVIEGASLYGYLAVGVPGTVAGLWAAHQRFGSLPWQDLLQPAVDLAASGFIVPDGLVAEMKSMQSEFAGKTNFDRYFGNLQAGTVFRQPELAATLRRIAEQGPDGFYHGKTAALIVAEMARGDGLVTTR